MGTATQVQCMHNKTIRKKKKKKREKSLYISTWRSLLQGLNDWVCALYRCTYVIYNVRGWETEDRNEWEEVNTKEAHLEKFCQRIHWASMITQPPIQED